MIHVNWYIHRKTGEIVEDEELASLYISYCREVGVVAFGEFISFWDIYEREYMPACEGGYYDAVFSDEEYENAKLNYPERFEDQIEIPKSSLDNYLKGIKNEIN